MKKLVTFLLVTLLTLSCLAGCTKDNPEPAPQPTITPTVLNVEDAKKLLKGKDEIADGLQGSYTIVSSNTQNDKNEMVVRFAGENEEYTYEAEYNIKSTFKDGSWVMDSFFIPSAKKTPKTPSPQPQPQPQPQTDPSSLTEEQIVEQIKDYLIKKDDLDEVSCSSITVDSNTGTASMVGKVRWRYINDTNKYKVDFEVKGKEVVIKNCEMTSQKTLCNLDDYPGNFYVSKSSGNLMIQICFDKEWNYRFYYWDKGASSGPDSLFGSYSISGDTIKLSNPDRIYQGNINPAVFKFRVAKTKLANGEDGYQLTILDDYYYFPSGTVLQYSDKVIPKQGY